MNLRTNLLSSVVIFTASLLMAALCVLAEADGAGSPKHASLEAYPQAVITLKDKATKALFYVESNGRTLVCFDSDGRLKWALDVIATIKPGRGPAVVRDLTMKDGKLWAICGRSSAGTVDPESGKVELAGND